MDCKERIINSLKLTLHSKGVTTDVLNMVIDETIKILHDYADACTDIVVRDSTDEMWIKMFMATLYTEGKSNNTATAYRYSIKRLQEAVPKPFAQMTTNDIKYFLAIKSETCNKLSVDNERARLSAFFSWLTNEEYIDKNPMAKIKKVKYEVIQETPFNSVEIDKIRESTKDLRDRAVIEFLLSTGVRVAELCSLNKEDINFNTNEVRILHGKGDKPRTVYMNDVAKRHLVEYLQSRTDDTKYLIVTKHGVVNRLHPESVRGSLHKLEEISGVTNIHPHRFRKTLGTNMSKHGIPLEVIQQVLGHSDINTTKKRYVVLDDKYIKVQTSLYF